VNHIDLNQYGLRVVNFECIFNQAYKDIVDDLFTYEKFHDLNVRQQDTKRIYYYHMIKHTCDNIISHKTNNRVVIYYCDKDIKCDFKRCDNKRTRKGIKTDRRPEFVLFMSRFFKHLKSMIPVKCHVGDVKFNTFIQYYNTNKGKYIETINKLRSSHDCSRMSMEKIKKFTNKYQLNYITTGYLNNLKIKGALYK